MQMRLLSGPQILFHGVKNLSIDTKNTSVVEKLEYFIFFGVQLC